MWEEIYDSSGNFPSGINEWDAAKIVLDKVFAMEKKSEGDDVVSDDQDEDKDEEENADTERPDDWRPLNWMAFLIFGPFGKHAYGRKRVLLLYVCYLTIMYVPGTDVHELISMELDKLDTNPKGNGRQALRNADSLQDDKDRNASNTRGVATATYLQLVQNEEQLAQHDVDSSFVVMKELMSSKAVEFQQARLLVEAFPV